MPACAPTLTNYWHRPRPLPTYTCSMRIKSLQNSKPNDVNHLGPCEQQSTIGRCCLVCNGRLSLISLSIEVILIIMAITILLNSDLYFLHIALNLLFFSFFLCLFTVKTGASNRLHSTPFTGLPCS